MMHLKMLGLALVAAMAFMAFGAGSASADVLCKTAPNKSGECPTTALGEKESYAANTSFTGESTNAKLTVEGGITSYVTCEKSNVALKNTSAGSDSPGASVPGEITQVNWTNCSTAGGSSCVVSESKGYTGSVKATNSAGTGEVHITGSATTTVDCTSFGFNFKCTYKLSPSGIALHLTGGNPASIIANEQPLTLEAGGFGCGSGAKWDATYNLTGTNKALWVATKNA